MKKLNLLLAVLVAMLMFSSCEEDDSVEPKDEPKITTEDLVGDWGFQSLYYEGDMYYECNDFYGYPISEYTHGILNFYEMTESRIIDYQMVCEDNYGNPMYSLEDSVITISQNLEFEIIKCNESLLKLKLIDAGKDKTFIGGIYTLEKVQ